MDPTTADRPTAARFPDQLRPLLASIRRVDPAAAARITSTRGRRRPDRGLVTIRESLAALGSAGRADDWHRAVLAISVVTAHFGHPVAIRDAALDAALAVMARDLVTPARYQELAAPWAAGSTATLASVIGVARAGLIQ